MQLFWTTLKAVGVFAILASLSFSPSPAGAKGMVLIRQSDGDTNTYDHVTIKVLHGALYVTTADGKGTLVINRAACSHQAAILVCLVNNVTLIQGGKTRSIDLKTGTLYFNDTDSPQQLVLSTSKVPPHSLLMSMTTDIGTYVALTGRLDKVVK
jgi:hypothetical protein